MIKLFESALLKFQITGLNAGRSAALQSIMLKSILAKEFAIIPAAGGVEHRFLFPKVMVKTEFETEDEVRAYLKSEANEGGAPELDRLYEYVSYPAKCDIKNLTLRCRVCKTQIKFYSNGIKLMMISADCKHIHRYSENSKDKNREGQARYIENNMNKPQHAQSTQPPSDVINVQTETPQPQPQPQSTPTIVPAKKTIIEQDAPKPKGKQIQESNDLTKILGKHGFTGISRVSQEDGGNSVVFGINANMKSNMERFGDIVGFDLTECSIEDTLPKGEAVSYKLAIFTAFDSNCRILLLGFGLMRSICVADLFRLFKFFFKTLKKPQGFVTGQDPAVLRTFSILREIDVYRGLHLLDKNHVLEDLGLQGNQLRLATKLIEEGSQQRAFKYLDEISQNMSESTSDAAFMALLEKKDNMFLWSMPSTFVGLSFSSSQQIKSLMSQHFQPSMNFANFLKTLSDVDLILTTESCKGTDLFKEPTEELFRDGRIKDVRLNFESNIFKIFLRQYIWAVKEMQIIGKTEDGSTHVVNKYTNATHEITNGRCSCKEDVKTGIPCSHLIASLIIAPEENYSSYFANRWSKKPRKPVAVHPIKNRK